MKTIRIALQGLRGAPVRSVLVIATLTLGMLGFIAVFSATDVLRNAAIQRALLIGGPVATVQLSVSLTAPDASIDTTLAQLLRRTGADAVAATTANDDLTMWVAAQNNEDAAMTEAAITFATPTLRDIRPLLLTSGEWISEGTSLAPRGVVNEAAAALLDDGSTMELGTFDSRVPVPVVGIVRDGFDQPQVYLPLSDYATFGSRPMSVSVVLHGPALTADEVTRAGRELIALGAPFEVGEATRTDRINALADEVATSAQVLFVLGVLALASTVIGILNVGLSSATIRGHEFALRRVMGARRTQVAAIVITESQILALLAAAIAFGGSFLLVPLVVGSFGARLGIAPPPFDPVYGLVCLAVACASALVSSIVPALLSYRRDLSDVMRR
ncbi:ABC transporter permease [Microbacterium sp.]|uniref:ABC transporter permease n=1 Tax=Microbacterium sp. TaxID=51671 RepID=UPI003A83BA1D